MAMMTPGCHDDPRPGSIVTRPGGIGNEGTTGTTGTTGAIALNVATMTDWIGTIAKIAMSGTSGTTGTKMLGKNGFTNTNRRYNQQRWYDGDV